MDIQMKEMSGLEAAEQILIEDAEAKILFLTTFSDDEYIVKALNIGAKGYILKQDFEGSCRQCRQLNAGRVCLEEKSCIRPGLMQSKEEFDYEKFDISEKEQAIIEQVALGKSNREIAGELFLSEGTVRNYISLVLDKLSLRDRTQLAIFYYQNVR